MILLNLSSLIFTADISHHKHMIFTVKPQQCPHFHHIYQPLCCMIGVFHCSFQQHYCMNLSNSLNNMFLWNVVESVRTRHNTIKQFMVEKCGWIVTIHVHIASSQFDAWLVIFMPMVVWIHTYIYINLCNRAASMDL